MAKKKIHFEEHSCSDCGKIVGEKGLVPTPNGFKCYKCVNDGDLEE